MCKQDSTALLLMKIGEQKVQGENANFILA